jgi:hypothetical protein
VALCSIAALFRRQGQQDDIGGRFRFQKLVDRLNRSRISARVERGQEGAGRSGLRDWSVTPEASRIAGHIRPQSG